MGIDRDVTDLKAIQIALRESEERFRSAFEYAAIGMAIVDLDGRWVQINRALTEIVGYTEQELRETTFQAITHPDDLELDLRLVNELLTGKIRSYQMEKRYFHKRGNTIAVLLTVALVRDPAGQPLYFVSQIQDISERKRTEEALRRAEARYRTLVEQLPVIIYTADINAESSTNYVSPQIETILGFSPSEWLANPNLWIEQVYPDDRAIVLDAVQQAQASDAPVPLEYRSFTRGGEVVWLHDAARVVRDEDGQPLFLQGVTLDITERKRFEHALIEERALLAQRVAERTADLSLANAELARAAQLKDEFLASMSHELRTPLNAVLGLSEALQELVYGPLNERQQVALHNITTSGQHLLDLINDILDLAKIGAGKLTLDLEPTPIAHICEAGVRIVKPLAEKKGQSLSLSIDPNVQIVSADARRLKQVVVNLLSNAIKFTPEGGAIGLEVAGDRARQAVDISVWDTGIGIAPDQLTQLFQPFVQLDRRLARQYSGTGLGLSLVARMVALHGGGVAVSSTVGSGSRFTAALPWPEADRSAAGMPAPEGAPAVAPAAQPSPIVLADDDETSSTILSEHLRHAGYEVIIARNGAEAIARAREARPAVVIVNVQLQGIPGIELARRLRTDDALPNLPIIMLNGRALPGDREQCLAADCDVYLTKPVGRNLLIATIGELIHSEAKANPLA
jgi:PAS domain S-box-containing protein